MPDPKGASRPLPPEETEWGYFIINAETPLNVLPRLQPINPKFQAKADTLLLALRAQWLKEDR